MARSGLATGRRRSNSRFIVAVSVALRPCGEPVHPEQGETT
jgi:hypothetical protein